MELDTRPAEATRLDGIPKLSEVLTAEYLEEHRVLPVTRTEEHVVIAHAGPTGGSVIAELESLFGLPVELQAWPEPELLAGIRRVYGTDAATAADFIARLEPEEGEQHESGAHDVASILAEPPVVRLVNLLLSEAVAASASDVHLVEAASGLQVQYRIDGVLHDAPAPPAHLVRAVLTRLKVMAELDIAERRLPQDGRIRLRVESRDVDVRVSCLPVLHGESMVIRLLDVERQRLDFDRLGMADDHLEAVARFGQRPQGVLLATGPTGSGKTTTLHALIDRVRTGREKVVSVEDPVEYEHPNVAQVPVLAKGGLTFARALRSILRQDPDIILVGEMRDAETTELCIQAALTGHLVLSTLHTNDAPSALTRLSHLGVAPYLVTSTVEMVLAQRLVRTTCPECGEWRDAGEDGRVMALEGWQTERVRCGKGCPACRGTGYRGRTGIYELLVVDDEIRDEVMQQAGSGGIRRMAIERGMRPLRTDGWRQVAAGVTTPEEVLRVAGVT
jgi:general secretion pathway protein E